MAAKRLLIVACVIKIAVATSLSTYAADPVISQLKPQGGQRGTDVEVTIIGQRLGDGPYQILLYDSVAGKSAPGIVAPEKAETETVQAEKPADEKSETGDAPVEDSPDSEAPTDPSAIEIGEIETVDGKQVKCTFRLAEHCPVGRHALRLRTASGLSNLLTFHVGNLKEIDEVEPNNAADAPQQVASGVVVNGVVTAGDVDQFAVEVAAGERLSVEIEGLRLGRTMFDPVVEFYDPEGNLIASSDDQPAAHQDAFLSMLFEKAGQVIVLVRESAYRGSGAATYRLHVGKFPRPLAVYPPVAMPGKPVELTWIGDTVDQQQATVDVPPVEDKIYEAFASDETGISPSGLPLYLSETPASLEIEPNDSRDTGNELNAPGVACGIISKPADKDYFHFTMKKGQEWDFRVRARELRSPLDPVLHLFDTNGKYVKGNDDNAGQPDSYLRYKAPADGEYTVDVEDRLLRGREEMTYVLEITKPHAVAEIKIDERRRYNALTINVPQGGRTAAMMTVKRKDFGGELQLDLDGLPTGCEVQADPLSKDYNRLPVLFTAKADAELGASLASVAVKLTEKPRPIETRFRQQTWLVRGRNNVHVWSHFAERAPVAVTKALPFSIRVVEPKAPLVQGGSMELKVVAKRDEGFENSIAVRTLYNPPGMSTNQSRSIKKNELEALIPITANGKARTGEWKLAFLGKASIQGAVEASSQLATLRIVEPYFNMRYPTRTVQQGETAELVVTLEQRHPFEGDAQLELIRLPHGVTAEKVQVKADSEQAVFKLSIAKDARVGRHRGVGCQALLTVEGEPVRYAQGYVDLCVDPASKTGETKTAKRKNRSQGEAS